MIAYVHARKGSHNLWYVYEGFVGWSVKWSTKVILLGKAESESEEDNNLGEQGIGMKELEAVLWS